MNLESKQISHVTQLRSLTPEELSAEFDLVYLEVAGFLQPIPADKVRSILPVFETTTVYADIGNRSAKFAEIEITLETLAAGLSRAESPIDSNWEDMESWPFDSEDWKDSRPVFTLPACDYCGHKDCQC